MRIQILEGAKEGFLDIATEQEAILNLSITDISNVGSVSGAYSNTFEIANTKEAQEILSHYFNVNVKAGSVATFDARRKVKVAIVSEEGTFKDDLFLRIKNLKVRADGTVRYFCELKDDKADFFNAINNKMLTDLDFSDGNHVLTRELIHGTFGNTSDNSVFKYHLTTTNGNEYFLNQFKPAIWAKHYASRIAANEGFNIEIQDNEKIKFKDYLIPCTRQNMANNAGEIVKVNLTEDSANYQRLWYSLDNYPETLRLPLVFDEAEFNQENSYNTSTGVFTPFLSYPAGEALLFRIDFEAEVKIINGYHLPAHQVNAYNRPNEDNGYKLKAFINKIPSYYASGSGTSETFFKIPKGETLEANETKNLGVGFGSVLVPAGDLLSGQGLELKFAFVDADGTPYQEWEDSMAGVASVSVSFVIKSAKLSIVSNVEAGFYLGNMVKLNDYVPDKVKQSDLFKMIAGLNNMYIDKIGDRRLRFVRREDFYKEGRRLDWSSKIDMTEYELTEISELTNKKQIFTYKEDKDLLNQTYLDKTGDIYGQFSFTFDSEHVRGENVMKLAFAPTPLHNTNFGAIVPALNGIEPKHEPRILLDGGNMQCQPYKIKTEGLADYVINDGFPYVGHFDNPINPNLDLNFGVCKYYFTPSINRLAVNNMFNLNWRAVMYQINEERILKARFNLNKVDLETFSLKDTVFVLGRWWTINKASINLNRSIGANNYLASLELIPETENEKVKPSKKPTGGKPPRKPNFENEILSGIVSPRPTGGVLNDLVMEIIKQKNNYQGTGVIVTGTGNTISEDVTSAIVLGDNQVIEGNGFFTPNFSISEKGVRPNVSVIDAGQNVVLSLGVSPVTFQVIDAGKDNVLNLGGTKEIDIFNGRVQFHSSNEDSTNAPNEDFDTFQSWSTSDLATSEIGINNATQSIFINFEGTIVKL